MPAGLWPCLREHARPLALAAYFALLSSALLNRSLVRVVSFPTAFHGLESCFTLNVLQGQESTLRAISVLADLEPSFDWATRVPAFLAIHLTAGSLRVFVIFEQQEYAGRVLLNNARSRKSDTSNSGRRALATDQSRHFASKRAVDDPFLTVCRRC